MILTIYGQTMFGFEVRRVEMQLKIFGELPSMIFSIFFSLMG
jgi:hypothetical protein